ncbi:hypothetical protein [Nocardioides nematodiphilus]|uniref:hypothetical protein n=1 Tax=Nocardioides nematodiphilus TaxID=2849669 RepID=UPI001CDA03BD|nr:hypothetical protein [Nocardioides nematodiphilus]MCA1982458.1 hypothetical protein [Nocardioides nematodiphilus]
MLFPVFARRLVLLVGTVIAACVTSTQGDTWWALRAGRDIWHHRTISLVDRYSYTAAGDPWPDHEWLWQALIYPVHVIGGLPLLTLCAALLAGGTLALSTASGTVRRTDLVVLVLAIPALAGSWSLRPQMVSMLCFALILWLLREQRWWWCPPLMLVWANAHGGVVYGGLALGAACLAALLLRERRRFLRPLLVVTALGALATLLTPLGTGLWHYVLTSGSRPFEDRINEWKPAYEGLSFFSGAFWAWVGGVVVLVAVSALRPASRRRLRTWPAALGLVSTLATLPLAIDARRNMTMFVIAAIPLAIELLRPATPRVRPRDTVPLARPILVGAGIVGPVAIAATYLSAPASLAWHPIGERIERAVESCPGHVYTSYDSGAYLIWFTPGVTVFADNRQDPYSEQILDLSILDPSSPYVDVFKRYDVRCAALLSRNAGTIETLSNDGWTTAAREGRWIVLTAPGVTLNQ